MSEPIKSWAPQVIADGSNKWFGNQLRFPTEDEALANVANLKDRWLLVTDTRVVPSNDKPTHHWIAGTGLVPIGRPGTGEDRRAR
jgi:hypothetical protein